MAEDTNETNTVKYPGTPSQPEFDTVDNWPATTKVTQDTGEDVTRNRDALLVIERLLGPNPHIGLFTSDLRTTSIAQRLSILEQGVSEGRFEFKKLKVERAIETVRNLNETITLVLGAARTAANEYTQVEVRGPLRVFDSEADDPRARFDVGFLVEKAQELGESTECEIRGSSVKGKPLLLIEDFNRAEINDRNHTALEIRGNLFVSGYIDGNFALDHQRLNNIQTDPVIDAQGNVVVDAVHVSRGNYHSHKRGRYDPTLARWVIDSNPQEATYGIVNHNDLEPQSTRTSVRQRNFVPDTNIAYHVTNGDDHDHVGGDGAPLRHKFILGVDPKNSNHITGGDFHRHDPDREDGGLIPTHGIVLQEDLEQSLQNLSLDPENDPVVAAETASKVLTRINDRFVANDQKNEEQDNRLDVQEGELEQAKLTRQEFNQVRSSVNTAVAGVTQLTNELEATNTAVETNTQGIENNAAAILLFLEQTAAFIFGTTIRNLLAGQKVYGVGGAGGATGAVSALDITVDYQDVDDTGTDNTRTSLAGTTTINSSATTASLASTPEEGSTIVPRTGILQFFTVRAAEDLPVGAEIAITVYKNFEPTLFSLILTHEDLTAGEIPDPVTDQTGQVEVELGDFITFEFFNRNSVDVTNLTIAATIGFKNPPPTAS